MSSGDPFDSPSNNSSGDRAGTGQAEQLEDFSPPEGGDMAGSGNCNLDVLDLAVKFQLLGDKSESLVKSLRSEAPNLAERQLAGLLLERGYVDAEEMDSLVLARYLLACGKITMAQLELVMDEIMETGTPLWVTLVAKGWLKVTDVV